MKLRSRLILIAAFLAASTAHGAPGITLYGEPKYPPGFKHFAYVNPSAPKGGTLKLAALTGFDSLNPYILKGLPAPGVTNFVFQSLMIASYDEPQSYYPLIATDIALAEDRSYADFTLNKKATWHDGKPITADDVVWTLRTLKKKGHPLYRVLYKPVTEAKKLDAHRVRFTFSDKLHRELPLIVASMPVLPKHYYATHPFDKTTLEPPLGSGPYRIAKVDAGRAIRFERVKNYWAANLSTQRGMFNFDTINIDIYRDDVVALEGIKSNQFDYYEEYIARNWATAYDIPAVREGRLIKAGIPHKIPRGMQGFMFNTRRDKFADRRVREAIDLTLDFEWMNGTLFYNAYTRNRSFFEKTPFEATGLPEGDELALLEKFRCETTDNASRASTAMSPRSGAKASPVGDLPKHSKSSCLPSKLFTHEYAVPTTQGDGFARTNLIRAQTLLNDAGWVMRDGVRVNAKTGEPLTIEFLMTQRTFERVIGIMRYNLKKLGIESEFRYVDASQYQRRLDKHNFDIVSIWWNQGLFYPGSEQYTFWHSSQADIDGSQNTGGVKNKAVDFLVKKVLRAQNLEELAPAARALDRVLLWEHYVVPHWSIHKWRVLYWNKFARPKVTPDYNICTECWWMKKIDEPKNQKINNKAATHASSPNRREDRRGAVVHLPYTLPSLRAQRSNPSALPAAPWIAASAMPPRNDAFANNEQQITNNALSKMEAA